MSSRLRPLSWRGPFPRIWPQGARHRAEGVRVHLDTGVAAITPDAVTLTDGRFIPADLVIAAIGVVPQMDLAETAGLATGNGILTDACLRTSDLDILAAGDCAAVEIAPGLHCGRKAGAMPASRPNTPPAI